MILSRLAGYLLFLLCTMYVAAEPALSLKTSTTSASEGYLTLSWGSGVTPTQHSVYLKITEDDASNIPVRYLHFPSPHQNKVHLSGFVNGHYSAVLLNQNQQPISNVARFDVQHRSLKTALILFTLGLALFITLLVLVISFTRKTDK